MSIFTNQSVNLTEGSLNKSIFSLAVPAMISMVSIMLFEIIDLLWTGRLGAKAVAALGAASFVMWAVKALANCVAAGLNALVARNAGAKNQQRVQLWASQGMMLTVLFSVIISIIIYSMNLYLFQLLGLEPDVAQMAKQYTLIMSIGLIIIYSFLSLDSIFRAVGNTFVPMLAFVISLSLNAILDPFFMFGWFGFPKYGMPGGAVASVIAHVIGTIFLLYKLPGIKIRCKYVPESFWKNSLEVLRIGAPIGLLGAVFSFIYIILSKNIAYYGTTPLAAISICHRVEGIPFFVAFGFSTAVSALVGQNLGASKSGRAEKITNLSLLYVTVFLFLTSIGFIVYGRSIMSLFIDNQAVIEEGYNYLFAISFFEIFLASEIVLEGAFTGAGDTKPPFLISIPLTFLRIPGAYFFSIVLNYGVEAIWWVISVSTFLKGTIFYLWFRRGKWKLKQIG